MANVNDIIKNMWEYQKINNVTKQCVTNSQYLRDTLINNYYIAKVKAVIMTSSTESELEVYAGHLVVEIEDKRLIDASYETNFKENQNYFDNIPTLLLHYPEIKNDKQFLSFIIKKFLEFNKIANEININDTLCVTDKIHYNKQADYLEMKLIK